MVDMIAQLFYCTATMEPGYESDYRVVMMGGFLCHGSNQHGRWRMVDDI